MRRLYSFIGVALMIMLSSCSSRFNRFSQRIDPVTNFLCEAKVTISDKVYTCVLTRRAQTFTEIRVTAPDNIKGLTFKWLGDTCEESYEGLICKTDTIFIPEISFIKLMHDVMYEMATPESLVFISSVHEKTTYEGVCDLKQFNVTIDNNTGFIEKVVFEVPDIVMEFSQYT